MDPCSFVRILVGNLAVRFPGSSSSSSSSTSSGPSASKIHPSTPRICYCKIKFKNFPCQIVTVPVFLQPESESESEIRSPRNIASVAACFSLTKAQIEKFVKKPKWSVLSVEVYSASDGGASCGIAAVPDKLLGQFQVSLDIRTAETRAYLVHNGWVALGIGKQKSGSGPELHLSVRVEPDPRFVFQFDGEPECSPQIFQVQGSTKQAVFTCKFGFRNTGDRSLIPSLSMSEPSAPRSCISSLKAQKEHLSKERKGWSITIHDLSGSPVAMASMVTPFVPSPGSNRVTRSSPGAWLILRPDGYTWKPWGRLEAWRESGGFSDAVGYRFEHFHDSIIAAAVSSSPLASSSVSMKHGGDFVIDVTGASIATTTPSTPTTSPQGSWDLGSGSRPGSRSGSGSWSDFGYLFSGQHGMGSKGFLMSATVGGVGKSSRPAVEVGVQHVTCTEDAAAHVALAAAVDLSMDACRLFSRKLRKELRRQSQLGCVV